MSSYSTNKNIISSSIRSLIIVFISLLLINSSGQAQSRSYPESARYLDDYLSRLEKFGFSGNVLFAHQDRIYFNKAYGLANIEKNIRNRPETMFQMDSMSKQFTATAILTLEMQGKLKVTDPITKFFEQVPPDKAEITLHHLLTHTSGIISGTTEYFEKNTKNDIIRIALESPLKFKPGASDSYSNIGYVLLAAVVEKVSGLPFDEYLSQNLFTPAGMNHTRLRNSAWDENLLAYRYDENNKRHSPFINYPDWNFIGGSGVLSTTQDLFLWHKALLGSSILSEEAKKKMFTPVANDYGYGWFIMDTPYGKIIRHGGGSSNGSAGHFMRYPDKDVLIIISSNQDGESRLFAERLDAIIERIVFGESIELPPQLANSSSPIDLAQFNGKYTNADGSVLEIISKKGFLEIMGNGQSSVAGLLTKSETEAQEYQRMTDKTGKILQDIINEDYSSLIAVAGEKSDARYKRYIELYGKAGSYQVLGTVPPTGSDNAAYMTIFQINYPKKEQIHRFYWSKEGKVVGLGGEGIRQAVKVKAVPKTANQLLSYNITLARSAIINLRRNNGRVNELIIGPDKFLAVEK